MTSPHSDAVAAVSQALDTAMKNMTRPHQAPDDLARVAITADRAWLAEHAATEFAAAVDELLQADCDWNLDYDSKEAKDRFESARTALLAMGPGRAIVVTQEMVERLYQYFADHLDPEMFYAPPIGQVRAGLEAALGAGQETTT